MLLAALASCSWIAIQGFVPPTIESNRQLEIEEALLQEDRELLQRSLSEVNYLFPRALDRVFEAQLLQHADSPCDWTEPLHALEWSGAAKASFERINELCSRSPSEARQVLLQVREELQAIEGECDSDLRRHAHQRIADGYRQLGLEALAYEHEVEVVRALVDGAPARLVLAAVEPLVERLAGQPFPLAEAEARHRYGQTLRAYFFEEKCAQQLEFALDLVGNCPDSRLHSYASDLRGWNHWSNGRQDLAERSFAEAEQVARLRGDWNRVARMLRTRAQCARFLDSHEASDKLYGEALRVATDAGFEWRSASIAVRHAGVLRREKRFEEVRELLDLARKLLHGELRDQCGPENRMSRMLYARYLTEEIELESDLSGDGYRMSADLERECTSLMSEELNFSDLLGLRICYVSYLRDSGELERAQDIAVGLLASARANDLFGSVTGVSSLLASILAKRGDHEAAFAQLASALEHWDKLREAHSGSLPISMVEISRNIASVSSEALQLAFDVWNSAELFSPERLRAARVALAFFSYGRAHTARQEMNLDSSLGTFDLEAAIEEQADRLGRDDLLLAFDTRTRIAIAATEDEMRLYELPSRQSLSSWISRSLHALEFDQSATRYARHTEEFSRELLGPVADLISQSARLICLADGELGQQPLGLLFAPNALPIGKTADTTSLTELPFLFREHSVLHVASLADLSSADGSRVGSSAGTRVALLAYPHGPHGESLPGVIGEARSIRALYPEEELDLLFDSEASEAALARLDPRNYSILHLASHVSGDPNTRSRSWIQLAPGNGEDGQVQIEELVQLNLEYDLVILSGCSAAEGIDGGAEGLVSIGWGCLCARARAILLSAFPVNDLLAERLMLAVHHELRAGHSPADALRFARITLMQQDDETAARAALLPFMVMQPGF